MRDFTLNKYSFIFSILGLIISVWSLLTASTIENFMRDNQCTDYTIIACKQVLQYGSWIFLIIAILIFNNIIFANMALDKLWIVYSTILIVFLLISIICSSLIFGRVDTICKVPTPTPDPITGESPTTINDTVRSQIIMNSVSLVIVIILIVIMWRFTYIKAGKLEKNYNDIEYYILDEPDSPDLPNNLYYAGGNREETFGKATFITKTTPPKQATPAPIPAPAPVKKRKPRQFVISTLDDDDD